MNTNLTAFTHETIGSATIINDSIENTLPFLESKSIGIVFIDIPIKHKLSDWRAQRFLRILDELYRVVKDDGRLVFVDRLHIGYSHVVLCLGDFIEICEEKYIKPSETLYEMITQNKADVKKTIEFKTNATREYKKKYEHLFAIGSHETGLLMVNEEPTYEITKKAKEKYLHELKSQFLHDCLHESLNDSQYTVLDLCQCCFHTCLAAAQANVNSIGVSGDVYYQNSKVELHNLASGNKSILPFRVIRYEQNSNWAVKTDANAIHGDILIQNCAFGYKTREEAIAAAKKCKSILTFKPKENEPI